MGVGCSHLIHASIFLRQATVCKLGVATNEGTLRVLCIQGCRHMGVRGECPQFFSEKGKIRRLWVGVPSCVELLK